MMSGHGANLIFFNKKNKDWASRTHDTPPPPNPLKADVTFVSSFSVAIPGNALNIAPLFFVNFIKDLLKGFMALPFIFHEVMKLRSCEWLDGVSM